jgi:hypothetical protein
MGLFARNYLPLGLAIVFGIANGTNLNLSIVSSKILIYKGYYAFQPILKEKHEKSELQLKSGQQTDPVSNDATSK